MPPMRPGWLVDPLLREFARAHHFCDGPHGSPSAGFDAAKTYNVALGAVRHWQSRVAESMCGDSAFGLWTADSLELQALADWTDFGEPNDGVVPKLGCHPVGANASRSPDAPHYTAGLNHFDLSCRWGDGVFGDDRKPCTWWANAARRARAQLLNLLHRE